MLKEKNEIFKQRIKNEIENISVDLFGLEEKVTENVTNYLKRLSKKENKVVPSLCVCISKPVNELRTDIYALGEFIRAITNTELIVLFTGSSSVNMMQESILTKIGKLLELYSQEYNISWEYMSIKISIPGSKLYIGLYEKDSLVKIISVKELIKFFV